MACTVGAIPFMSLIDSGEERELIELLLAMDVNPYELTIGVDAL